MSISRIVNNMSVYSPRQYIEIFHLILLRFLEKKLDKNLYALKGGCNLRFFFKSIRYSEDIDFDIRIISKETLRKNVNQILNSDLFKQTLKSNSIEILHHNEAKQSDTTQRWKISLNISGLSMALPTKLEFSRRDMTDDFIFEPVDAEIIRNYNLFPILLNHYSINSAVNQKINALIHRTETQARDIFDLKLLLDIGSSEISIHKKLSEKLPIAIENLLSIKFADFKSQVVSYLLPEYQEYYDNPKIWGDIQQRVLNYLDK